MISWLKFRATVQVSFQQIRVIRKEPQNETPLNPRLGSDWLVNHDFLVEISGSNASSFKQIYLNNLITKEPQNEIPLNPKLT